MNTIQSYAANSLSNILLSGYSQMNQVRLAQALSGRDGLKTPSLSQGGSGVGSLSTQDSAFLKDYQRHLQELKAAALQTQEGGQSSALSAGAADLSVAEVTGKLESRSQTYELTVEQLASGQINRSDALRADDPLPSMSGRLQLETSKGSYEIFLSGAGARDNREMLQNFAQRINSQNTGVTASVVEKDGTVSLQLEGASGAGNSFSVSGSLGQRLGLDQTVQTGRDAVYTLGRDDGSLERFSSPDNQVTLDGRLTARLKGTGTTAIQAGTGAASALADSLSQLVDRYNETLSFLDDNGDRGIGVLRQTKRLLMPSISERSMAMAGITVGEGGKLSFSRETFLESMSRSPDLVQDLTSRFAQGLEEDARQGMREPSADLLGNSLWSSSQGVGESQRDTIDFLRMYDSSGAYNLMNYYAVGVLMNLNA